MNLDADAGLAALETVFGMLLARIDVSAIDLIRAARDAGGENAETAVRLLIGKEALWPSGRYDPKMIFDDK
jgi:hypothetical protein